MTMDGKFTLMMRLGWLTYMDIQVRNKKGTWTWGRCGFHRPTSFYMEFLHTSRWPLKKHPTCSLEGPLQIRKVTTNAIPHNIEILEMIHFEILKLDWTGSCHSICPCSQTARQLLLCRQQVRFFYFPESIFDKVLSCQVSWGRTRCRN